MYSFSVFLSRSSTKVRQRTLTPFHNEARMLRNGDGWTTSPGSTGTKLGEMPTSDRDRLDLEVLFQSSLLDHLNSAVIATDPDGCITHWNRHAEEIYQWTRDEVLGRSIFEVNT